MKTLWGTTLHGLKMSNSISRWSFVITAFPSTNILSPQQREKSLRPCFRFLNHSLILNFFFLYFSIFSFPIFLSASVDSFISCFPSNCNSWILWPRSLQIAKALKFIHEHGVAHLDVKPENIYVKHGVYKLGDFGCARLINGSLAIEEGDARYMPLEILNDKYEHLDKVDIFSLGVAIYELLKGSPLPESGPQFLNLREGKIPLLPGHSMQLQNLLKVQMSSM